MRGFVTYGDPHGDWAPLLKTCREPPDGAVIGGDCDLEVSSAFAIPDAGMPGRSSPRGRPSYGRRHGRTGSAVALPGGADAVAKLHSDVLVTPEVRSPDRHGFVGVRGAAVAWRAKLVVHRRFHDSYDGPLPDGTWEGGWANTQVFRIAPEIRS